MTNQSWALEQMMKYQLCVDFYTQQIIDPDGIEWYWGEYSSNKTFYELLQIVVTNITKDESE